MTERAVSIHLRVGRREATLALVTALLLAGTGTLSTADLTLTTYYPSPYGVYKNLRSTDDAYLAYQAGDVGVGTTNPQSKLHVAGDARFDGNVGVGGAFVDTYGTGLSVRGHNLHVQGNENPAWLRLGDVWGDNGVYSESGELVLGAQSGWVRVGDQSASPDERLGVGQTLFVANPSCGDRSYGAGVTWCPGGEYATYTDGLFTRGVSRQSVPTINGGTYADLKMAGGQPGRYDAASGYMRCCQP